MGHRSEHSLSNVVGASRRFPSIKNAPVVSESDVVVIGGGPAGVAAAVSAARNGASVTLLERYGYLGGLASGGMVLVLDDMVNGDEITVKGLCQEYVDRMAAIDLAIFPDSQDLGTQPDAVNRWTRWGLYDFQSRTTPKPIVYAVAFDPDGWKRVSNDLIREAGVNVRLHSWFMHANRTDDRVESVVCLTKSGMQAVRGRVFIDASGDADLAADAGAPFAQDSYLVTSVFRLGGVDTDAAEEFESAHPQEARALNRRAKLILGGAWDLWWFKTPLPGIVWCNCPHMSGIDGIDPSDLTTAEFLGRDRIVALHEYARSTLPGFASSYIVDVAPQIGVRQTRLIQGEYVVTKDDVTQRRHFTDSVARGRDYYTPYRSLLPMNVEQLLVVGRHYSAEPEAQRISREIPPCMAMGEAGGVAAAIALKSGTTVRNVDVGDVQRQLREQGADPGDVPSANAMAVEQTI
jgi:FAD dependent oxidoreductase